LSSAPAPSDGRRVFGDGHSVDFGRPTLWSSEAIQSVVASGRRRATIGNDSLKTTVLPSRRGYGYPADHFIDRITHTVIEQESPPYPLCTVRPDFGRRDNSPDSRRYRRGRLVFGPEVLASAGRGDCHRTFISFVAVAFTYKVGPWLLYVFTVWVGGRRRHGRAAGLRTTVSALAGFEHRCTAVL